ATIAMTSPVEGFSTGNVLSPSASRHLPAMNRRFSTAPTTLASRPCNAGIERLLVVERCLYAAYDPRPGRLSDAAAGRGQAGTDGDTPTRRTNGAHVADVAYVRSLATLAYL